MQKILSLSLAAALTLSLATPALALSEETFPAVNEYVGYTDVTESDWYYENAKLCYEVGLMEGTNAGFEPSATMTCAQVMTLAARLHATLNGQTIPTVESDQWYDTYVTYLESAGVATLADPNSNATRTDFLTLLAAVLTEDILSPINEIETLPDTNDADVLAFYNAGILTGMDDYGTFSGDKTLTRAEASAMLSRIVREELRVSFVPATVEEEVVVEEEYVDFSMKFLGVPQDTVLATAGDYEVTAQDALPYIMTHTWELYMLLIFDTLDDSIADSELYDYIAVSPIDDYLLIQWLVELVPDEDYHDEVAEYLATSTPNDYLMFGMSYDYYCNTFLPALILTEKSMAQYGESEMLIAHFEDKYPLLSEITYTEAYDSISFYTFIEDAVAYWSDILIE